jgi:hypothetical protein
MTVSVTFGNGTGINPIKAGWALGTLLGLWHLTWSALVAVGWAQAVIDFVFWMHFIKPVYVIEAFDPAVALVLVIVTSSVGFVIGAVLGLLWNWIHKWSRGQP